MSGFYVKGVNIKNYFLDASDLVQSTTGGFRENGKDIAYMSKDIGEIPITTTTYFKNKTVDLQNIYADKGNTVGLSMKIYDGYFNTNLTYDSTNTPVYHGRVISDFQSIYDASNQQKKETDSPYTIVWSGYFKSNHGGQWTFSTTSDDGSYLWLGYTGTPTSTNADVNNGGTHGMTLKTSAIMNLNGAQTPYNFRVIYGNNSGTGNIYLNYAWPDDANTSQRTTFSNKTFLTP